MKTAVKKSAPKKKANPLTAKEISSHVGKLPYEERTNLISHLSKVGENEQRMKGDGQEPDGTGYEEYPE